MQSFSKNLFPFFINPPPSLVQLNNLGPEPWHHWQQWQTHLVLNIVVVAVMFTKFNIIVVMFKRFDIVVVVMFTQFDQISNCRNSDINPRDRRVQEQRRRCFQSKMPALAWTFFTFKIYPSLVSLAKLALSLFELTFGKILNSSVWSHLAGNRTWPLLSWFFIKF